MNREIKNKNQVALFNLIEKEIPASSTLVDAVSDFLGVGHAATYRRIRGDKPVSLEETIKLCKHFNISIDSLANITVGSKYFLCGFAPFDFNDINNYLAFAQGMSAEIENMRLMPEKEILLSAVDIPVFYFLAYNELTYFNLYTWNKNICNYPANFEDFFKEAYSGELAESFKKLVSNYQFIPSTEIWTDNTINSTLKMLDYHFEMGHFNDKKTPLLICEQLLVLMDTLYDCVKTGSKAPKVPFKFYVSDIDIGNSFLIFKKGKLSHTLIRLYTINGLSISDELFCKETENWLHSLIKKASLISGASEKERHKFFETQKQKIENLIEKIKQ